jgi:hypothetical protein
MSAEDEINALDRLSRLRRAVQEDGPDMDAVEEEIGKLDTLLRLRKAVDEGDAPNSDEIHGEIALLDGLLRLRKAVDDADNRIDECENESAKLRELLALRQQASSE